MKKLLFISLLFTSTLALAQDQKISTIDFVQILNDNREEAIFYYENNWLELRKMAIERGYVYSYEIMETKPTEEATFHLILKTTYPNQNAFDQAEQRFQELIKEKGELQLLNDKKPGEFRKVLFSKADARHLY
ncbi:hypothetical protein [Ekhidna sp.]|uniref:hypothetical protein n=1 Tax=Ekhidna sp. TaxID=2608089 RepID=UPI003B5C751F